MVTNMAAYYTAEIFAEKIFANDEIEKNFRVYEVIASAARATGLKLKAKQRYQQSSLHQPRMPNVY